MTRNEKIAISVLQGVTLKEAGKLFNLSQTCVRKITLRIIRKYDRDNSNIKRGDACNRYVPYGDIKLLRQQKEYLIPAITKQLFLKRKKKEKQLQMQRQVEAAHKEFLKAGFEYGTRWPIDMQPKIEDLYSTLDVVKALNIPRERLRDWMIRGFIKPSLPSTRKGTISIFTKDDILKVALFHKLLNYGLKRKVAATYIKEVFLYNKPNIIVIRSWFKKDGKRFIYIDQCSGFKKYDRIILKPFIHKYVETWENINIINIKPLLEEIKTALS